MFDAINNLRGPTKGCWSTCFDNIIWYIATVKNVENFENYCPERSTRIFFNQIIPNTKRFTAENKTKKNGLYKYYPEVWLDTRKNLHWIFKENNKIHER